MKRTLFLMLALAVGAAVTPLFAQNRVDQQMFLEIRTLQSQIQRLQISVNTLAEDLKKTETRLDSVTQENNKGFADQKLVIDGLAQTVRSLSERGSSESTRILQLSQEVRTIRDGLKEQQTALNQIIQLLQNLPTAGVVTDPNAPPPPNMPKPGTEPTSPPEYYNAAFQYFFRGQFENAITVLEDALKRFPDASEAPTAQMRIAESHERLNRNSEALAAFGVLFKTYKDPEILAEGYIKQGTLLEKTGQKTEAIKSFEQSRKVAPEGSTNRLLAEQHLKRLGVIK